MVTFEIPVKTVSEANRSRHEHWGHKRKRVDVQRTSAKLLANANLGDMVTPARIKLTRLAPRLLDDDNLRSALKACRDGIADAYGLDDRNDLLSWDYGQEKSSSHGVRVDVLPLP